MNFRIGWRQRATEMTSHLRDAANKASQRLSRPVASGLNATGAAVGEAYTAALSWQNNSEFSSWLTDHLSAQLDSNAKLVSQAMDAVYNDGHIAGNWHRLYDGTHTIAGSLKAATEALPDSDALDQLGAWANSYWNDLITVRGMPIITLDYDRVQEHGRYLKELDAFNLAEIVGGPLSGISIYCNWNDPAKLVASAATADCSAIVFANVVAPLVSLIALGRAYYLLKQSERDDLQALIAPALKGLTRSGASILLITVIPGGFLIHLSSGIVISIAHNYAWERVSENREIVLAALKQCLVTAAGSQPVIK